MYFSYQEFRERVNSREYFNFRDWSSTIQSLEELYDVNKFVFFYARNLLNNLSTELIIFLESGYMIVKRNPENSTFSIEEFRGKVTTKSLTASRYTSGIHNLIISFDNGNELTLNNKEDSNSDWEEEYATSIRKLYKVI